MLIIGSTALHHWFPDSREPKDFDIIQSPLEKNILEYFGFNYLKGKVEKYWLNSFQYILDNNIDFKFVDPNFLYTIKLSHSFWDVKWDKTIYDIIFLKNKGCQADEVLYKMLVNEWKLVHGKKKVNLNKNNDEFFKDNVKREYEHDELHILVAHYDRPLYERIKPDLNKANCSYKMFTDLSFEDKIKLCREEIFVVALERYLIPNDFVANEKAAFHKALKHLVTSMSFGWFPRFIVENIKEITNVKKLNLKEKLCQTKC